MKMRSHQKISTLCAGIFDGFSEKYLKYIHYLRSLIPKMQLRGDMFTIDDLNCFCQEKIEREGRVEVGYEIILSDQN